MRFCKYSKLLIGTNSVRVDIQCSNTMKTIDIQRFRRLLVFPTLINLFGVDCFKNLKVEVKILVRCIHQTAIKHLTYLVVNKRKLDTNQSPIEPPQKTSPSLSSDLCCLKEPTLPKEGNTRAIRLGTHDHGAEEHAPFTSVSNKLTLI